MNKNRIAKTSILTVAFVFAITVPGLARGYSDQQPAGPPSRPIPAGEPATGNAQPGNDFEGLDLSDDQKAEVAKIHEATEAKKAVVAKADKLNSDQKDAMILGYTRLEYGQIFRVLTPTQQRVVRKRINARKAADQGEKKPQHPGN